MKSYCKSFLIVYYAAVAKSISLERRRKIEEKKKVRERKLDSFIKHDV